MEEKNLEKEIKKQLLEKTDSSLEMKEDIWRQIEGKLDFSNEGKSDGKERKERVDQSKGKQKVKRTFAWVGAGIVAAILAITFTTNPLNKQGLEIVMGGKMNVAPGEKAIGEGDEKEEPETLPAEKKLTFNVEGMPEEKTVHLHESKLGYSIYIDEELYKMELGEAEDRIAFRHPAGDPYPDVSIRFKLVEDIEPAALMPKIKQDLIDNHALKVKDESVQEPVKGILISAQYGDEWNSIVTDVYLVANGKGGTFVIQNDYYIEARDGHGSRSYQILQEFIIRS